MKYFAQIITKIKKMFHWFWLFIKTDSKKYIDLSFDILVTKDVVEGFE